MFCSSYDKQYKKKEKWIPSSSMDDFEDLGTMTDNLRIVMVLLPKKPQEIR